MGPLSVNRQSRTLTAHRPSSRETRNFPHFTRPIPSLPSTRFSKILKNDGFPEVIPPFDGDGDFFTAGGTAPAGVNGAEKANKCTQIGVHGSVAPCKCSKMCTCHYKARKWRPLRFRAGKSPGLSE